ncbi:radical SAM/SPASM domain-containing protein [Candidatus Nitrospira allomarina]|uniref:Radical SAM protein n=1 Tax=Candidatus Nitrospira allomarina TaxID=3020900 RepID=A0AA96GD18_9BACT|nr:radical SAM protein [Candidatus Nitrospira allomarina]WNM58867.1 radical SAM protein [Candidatus Nitrospira allomarina]
MDDFKPYLVALNLTKRCNLKCEHCYLDATTKMGGGHDELTTEECFRLIDQIAQVNAGSLLVITGGEPLVRPDILEIARHAVEQRFMVVFGTNGMLIDDKMAKAMVDIGVMGVGISIDSLDPATHNAFRGLPGAWEGAMAGIEACKRNGLQFQVHFSAQPMNYKELPAVIDWSHDLGAKVLNVFFMVCTGRGEELTDITPSQYEEVLSYLVESQDKYQDMLVRARCAPHFKRLAYEKDPNSPITKAQGYMGGGCLAGTNYARVTPNGDLTPCPYMPLSAGNIRQTSFVDLWENSEVFNSFRYPHLKGKCGDCEYSEICGGCRARPYVDHGDAMDEDEWCLYTPKGGEKIKVAFNVPEVSSVEWEAAAEERLSRIPYFLRAMVKKGVERHAAEQGLPTVTIELMEELRKRRFGNEKPVFKF